MPALSCPSIVANLMRASLYVFSCTLLGCRIGPAYHVPSTPAPAAYKESAGITWQAASPGDAMARGAWWTVFEDPQLDELEGRVDSANQTIASSVANYDVARAIVRETRSQYFPTVGTAPAISNARIATTPYSATASGATYTDYTFPVSASWQPDLWGRVRKSVESNAYAAQAAAADLENVRLLAHIDLAADYFALRGVDEQKALLDETLRAWQRYLDLTNSLVRSGLSNDEALAAAESQLEAARAQDTNLAIARAQYEHAIATLIGAVPANVSVSAARTPVPLPQLPVGLPAELLQRRPDIASAERSMAAANAQIGLAHTAYFPSIVLSATGGIESLSFVDWFSWPSRIWSVGPSVAETIFDGGQRKATVARTQALYDKSVADYRETVLTAFQQVEDSLAALRVLSDDITQQTVAVNSAQRYLSRATARNTAGLDPFLNVINAQVSLLSYQQTLLSFRTQQRLAYVQLVASLGGGWARVGLPSTKQVAQLPGAKQ